MIHTWGPGEASICQAAVAEVWIPTCALANGIAVTSLNSPHAPTVNCSVEDDLITMMGAVDDDDSTNWPSFLVTNPHFASTELATKARTKPMHMARSTGSDHSIYRCKYEKFNAKSDRLLERTLRTTETRLCSDDCGSTADEWASVRTYPLNTLSHTWFRRRNRRKRGDECGVVVD